MYIYKQILDWYTWYNYNMFNIIFIYIYINAVKPIDLTN